MYPIRNTYLANCTDTANPKSAVPINNPITVSPQIHKIVAATIQDVMLVSIRVRGMKYLQNTNTITVEAEKYCTPKKLFSV